MSTVAVIVPVLGRPQRAQLLADSLNDAATLDTRLVFVCSPDDDAQIDACRQTGADTMVVGWESGAGDYQRKINHAFALTVEPYLFQAADDLHFEAGWDLAAVAELDRAGAGVCGTNDDANPRVKAGQHSTHSLIRRSYIDECGGCLEGPGLVLSEAYGHQWCDNELVELARWRDCFTFAETAIVRHFHPIWRTADEDATYRKGAASARADLVLFNQRRRAWAA